MGEIPSQASSSSAAASSLSLYSSSSDSKADLEEKLSLSALNRDSSESDGSCEEHEKKAMHPTSDSNGRDSKRKRCAESDNEAEEDEPAKKKKKKPLYLMRRHSEADDEIRKAEEESLCRYPFIAEALNCSQNLWLNFLMRNKAEVRRRALGLIAGSKEAAELEGKWRKLHLMRLEATKMESQLIGELIGLFTEALMSEQD